MIPKPPSSSEGSALPLRQRPNVGNLAKETTETDLWSFDGGDVTPSDAKVSLSRPVGRALPAAREPEPVNPHLLRDATHAKVAGGEEYTRVNLSRPTPPPGPGFSQLASLADDSGRWDLPPPPPPPMMVQSPPDLATMPSPPASPADELDEFSSPVRETTATGSLWPQFKLSKFESIGLVVLLGLLGGAGGLVYFLTVQRLPSKSEFTEADRFPVAGNHFTLVSGTSHWRVPQPTDTVRRGTQLLPVVTLLASGGPAAVRVFFRNSEGQMVGDAVTRSIKADSALEIGGTAGFDDFGMHAAYRTRLSKPWTIEIFEAASENSAGTDFKKLLVMDISSDRR